MKHLSFADQVLGIRSAGILYMGDLRERGFLWLGHWNGMQSLYHSLLLLLICETSKAIQSYL